MVDLRSNIAAIAVGAAHTVLLTHNGEVFACGDNGKGQAGVPGAQRWLYQGGPGVEARRIDDMADGHLTPVRVPLPGRTEIVVSREAHVAAIICHVLNKHDTVFFRWGHNQ